MKDFEWHLEPKNAVQGQTVYLTANDVFVMFQIVYSSMNTWSPTCQVGCRLYGKGIKKTYSFTHSASALKISSDRKSADCIQASILKTPTGYQCKWSHDGFVMDANLDIVDSPVQIGDGTMVLKNEKSEGYAKCHFIPRLNVSGHFIVDGKTIDAAGYATVLFPVNYFPQLVARWNVMTFHSKEASLILYELDTPRNPAFKAPTMTQAILVLNDKAVAAMTTNSTVYNNPQLDSFCGYKIQNSLSHNISGTTFDEKAISIKIALGLGNMLDKIDVLAELPFLIRKFIQAFITKPFVYQWYEPATLNIDIGGNSIVCNGNAFQENTFMDELF